MRSAPLIPRSARRASVATAALGGPSTFAGPLSGDEMVPIALSTDVWGTKSTPPLWSIGEHGVADGNQAMRSSFPLEANAQFLPGATKDNFIEPFRLHWRCLPLQLERSCA